METTQDGRTTTTDYIWCGARPCQSRSGASAVARLYYGEGEVVVPQAEKLYYGPDQLGSVRDMDVVSRTVSAPGQEYDYDPYGNPIATPAGVPLTDFRYAGMFYPGNGAAEGGLHLTQFRAYDPRIARWLSRDPLGERHGIDLYTYASDDPIDRRDASGSDNAWVRLGAASGRSDPFGACLAAELCLIYVVFICMSGFSSPAVREPDSALKGKLAPSSMFQLRIRSTT